MAMIRALDASAYRIPLPVALADSTHGDITHFELVTATVTDADGQTGLGYTFTVDSGGTAVHELVARDLAPVVIGADADLVEAIWQRMWWRLHFGGRGGQTSLAVSAVDIALWDLAAKRAGKPLWRHLGGHDPAVPCYAGGIDLHYDEAALLRQADGFLAEGFRAIKMKAGRPNLREDVARVRAMRRHLGDDFPLMADANMRWTADEAIRAARAVSEHGLVWLEEPTIPDDVPGHVRILRDGGHPIATGENFHSLHDFRTMIAAGGVSFPEPDVAMVGGVTVFMKVAALAEAFNLPVTSHGVHDITVHLLAACPNRSYLEIHGFGLDRFIVEPMERREGMAIAPERPGHGIAFDTTRLEPHRTRGP